MFTFREFMCGFLGSKRRSCKSIAETTAQFKLKHSFNLLLWTRARKTSAPFFSLSVSSERGGPLLAFARCGIRASVIQTQNPPVNWRATVRIPRNVTGTLVPLPTSVPACANPEIFLVSHFEICGYSEEAQRFLATTDLN